MDSGIYQIINEITKKRYIGSTVNFYQRWKRHRKLLNKGVHHSIILQNAWNKYGENAFVFELIEEVLDKSKLIEREQHCLDEKSEYNICKIAGSQLGLKWSIESRRKQSESHLGKKRDHFSPETRLKMSMAKKGQTPWNKGKTLSEEHVAKMKLAHLGEACSDEKKKKLSLSIKRKWPDPEYRHKMIEARKSIFCEENQNNVFSH